MQVNEIQKAIATKLATRYGVITLSVLLNSSPVVFRDYLSKPAKIVTAAIALTLTGCCLKLPDAKHEIKILETLTEIELATQREQLTAMATQAVIASEISKDTAIAAGIAAPPSIANHYLKKYQVPFLIPEPLLINDSDNGEPLTINPAVANNRLDLPEPSDERPLWLDTAIDSSVFISGKKGSGKTYLLKWLAQQFALKHSNSVFYIIDPHYDGDEPWLGDLDEKLAENKRLGNASLLPSAMGDVLRLLEHRKQNAITHKKPDCYPVRLFIDEIESLDSDWICDPIALIENEGRKYSISVCLGAHSTKKEQIGLDSSVLDSMMMVLFKNSALDVNAKFSGVFPSKIALKRMFDTYTLARERLVAVYDGDVYVSHVPPIDLNAFIKKPDPIEEMRHYCATNNDFNPATVAAKWLEITGKTLTESGLQMLLEKLETQKK